MARNDEVEITGLRRERYDEILTPAALALLATLQRELGQRRTDLLAARAERQRRISAGGTLDFLPHTSHIRDDPAWRLGKERTSRSTRSRCASTSTALPYPIPSFAGR